MEEANNLKTEYKRMLAAKDVAHDVAKNDPVLRRRMDFASAKKPDSRPKSLSKELIGIAKVDK